MQILDDNRLRLAAARRQRLDAQPLDPHILRLHGNLHRLGASAGAATALLLAAPAAGAAQEEEGVAGHADACVQHLFQVPAHQCSAADRCQCDVINASGLEKLRRAGGKQAAHPSSHQASTMKTTHSPAKMPITAPMPLPGSLRLAQVRPPVFYDAAAANAAAAAEAGESQGQSASPPHSKQSSSSHSQPTTLSLHSAAHLHTCTPPPHAHARTWATPRKAYCAIS